MADVRDWSEIERQLVNAGYPLQEIQYVNQYTQHLVDEQFYMDTNIRECRRCPLALGCQGPVRGTGSWQADVMLIGEAPAAQEEAYDLPLIGAAGQLLTWALLRLGVDRRRLYITNVVKCRTDVNNRQPTMDEIRCCSNAHLFNEIAIVQPKVIVTLGNPAMWAMRSEGSRLKISRERGIWREFNGIPMLHTYHPSYVLRKKQDGWPAMQEMMVDLQNAFIQAGMLQAPVPA
ncbi:uracil-DNA glycosylase [Alicyclobacillus shizuokensis]|uniref:uracil-DNA glycosylase n=1 Tax=Alicyclobacillus shizuokensis TaxID=392014 RepID=UPI00082BF418|nr:uracil-DNA glycosylase [Alicyclobacillus shizuokensis]